MKKLIKLLFAMLLGSPVYAQHVYQIRADSVRIYNVCDTAELIIENRTRGVNGFLYNKSNGRTEFRRLRLESIGGSQIAISGQDTLDISTLSGIRGIDTIYRSGNNIIYIKQGTQYAINAPLPVNETLQTVTARGNTTTHTIQFNNSSGNPSNGLLWAYNTDLWKIFVESPQDTPSGNMVFESADNGTEGWIFRSNSPNEQGVLDVFSLGRDRLNYKGGAVWHAGNHIAGTPFSTTLSGATVPASFTTNGSGHVTGFTTRNLLPSDIGAATEEDYVSRISSVGNPSYITPFTGDLNDISNNSISHIGAATNIPGNNPGFLYAAGNSNNASTGKFQLFGDYVNDDAFWYRRKGANGAWGGWYQGASRQWVQTYAIRNQFASAQQANAWITGIVRSDSQFENRSIPAAGGYIMQNTSGTTRWIMRTVNAEAGSNTGYDLVFNRRSDDGSYLSDAMTISRATGYVTIPHMPALTSAASVYLSHTGGTISTRTAAQVLSDIGAAPAFGSGNYIRNQFASPQTGHGWISGNFRAGGYILADNTFITNTGTSPNGNHHFQLRTGNVLRFSMGLINAESGSSSGSDFRIWRYSDAGVFLADVMRVFRASGVVQFSGPYVALPNSSRITGTAMGAANNSWLGFYASDGTTRAGYIGKASTSNNDINLVSDQGTVNIIGAAGNVGLFAQNTLQTSVAPGELIFHNGTFNRIRYATAGIAAPAFTTRSTGTKVVLYPSLSTTAVDYGIGMETGSMWHAVPQNNATYGFKWYGGTTEVARLDGAGNLDTRGLLSLGAVGSERLSARFNAIGFNRNANNGSIYSNTGHAYQFTHTASTTASSDVLDLQVYNPSGAGVAAKALSINGAGNISMSGTLTVTGNVTSSGQMLATSFYQSSLRNLKKNILPFTASALSILESAQVRTFQFKSDSTGKTNIGFIADEVPDEISIPGRKGVDQASTVALLVKSVQELSSRNEELEQRVKSLEALVTKMLNEKNEKDEN